MDLKQKYSDHMEQLIKQEVTFIILCSRRYLDHETENQANCLINTSFFDWDLFYTVSLEFGVLPLLYGHLKNTFKEYVPNHILKKIHHFFISNTVRNMVLTNELLKILDLFKTKNILAVPFKGPVLADMVYGSDALRTFSDLDILVQESEAVKARKILQEYGYRLNHELDEKYDEFYVKIEHAFNLQSPDGKVNIDLQWKLLGVYTPEPITLEKIKHRLVTQQFAGRDILHLVHEDLLFYLCVHGAKDGWEKFEWISCIAEMLRKYPDLNWNKVFNSAKQEHCLKKIKLGLYLASTLCKAPLPNVIEMKIQGDKSINILGEQFKEYFFSNKNLIPDFTNNPRFSPFHIQVQDDLKNKFRFVQRQLFRPTTKELLLWSAPGNFTFLYYIYRPLRLLWNLVLYSFNKLSKKSPAQSK